MKMCSKCKRERQLEDYNKEQRNPDGLQNYCKDCQRARCRLHYLANKLSVAEKAKSRKQALKAEMDNVKATRGCKLCGENDPCCLDFYHTRDKKFMISEAIRRKMSLDNVNEEVKKCCVLCANCHRKLHSRRMGI